MLWIKRVAQGLLMGLGCILPGVSGGVMAVSFGLYKPMVDALLGLRKNWRNNAVFLLPIALGGSVGVLLGALGLRAALARFETQLLYLFIGLILGGVPTLLKEAGPIKPGSCIAIGVGLLLGGALLLLGSGSPAALVSFTPIQAVGTGAIIAAGTVVPGVSTSFLLMHLGWYQAMLTAVTDMDWATLCWIVAGGVVCALLTLKLVQRLFERTRAAYYGVLGFLAVTVALVFPGLETGWPFLADLALLLGGLWLGLRMGGDA